MHYNSFFSHKIRYQNSALLCHTVDYEMTRNTESYRKFSLFAACMKQPMGYQLLKRRGKAMNGFKRGINQKD